MKYQNEPQLFAKKLTTIMIEKKMLDKRGNPDKIALYNLLNPNTQITEVDCEIDRQAVTDKTRAISNWLNGKNYPKTIFDVLSLCNVLDCDLDYFFTDMPAPTHDIEFVANTLNISHSTVLKLQEYESGIKSLFDKLVTFSLEENSCDFIHSLLLSIYDYGMSKNVSEITIKDKLFDRETTITEKETISAILSDSSHKTLDTCLEMASLLLHNDVMKVYDAKLQLANKQIEELRNKLKESDD